MKNTGSRTDPNFKLILFDFSSVFLRFSRHPDSKNIAKTMEGRLFCNFRHFLAKLSFDMFLNNFWDPFGEDSGSIFQ